jgi:hypothetical protein
VWGNHTSPGSAGRVLPTIPLYVMKCIVYVRRDKMKLYDTPREFLVNADVELHAIKMAKNKVDNDPMNIEAGVLSDEYDTRDLMAIGLDMIAEELKTLRDIVLGDKDE